MYCRNCGKECAEGTSFCPSCGTPIGNVVTQNNNQAAPVKKSGSVKTIVAVVAILLVLVGVTGVLLKVFVFPGGKKDSGIVSTDSDILKAEVKTADGDKAVENVGNKTGVTYTEQDYQNAVAFACDYGGEWKVKKYYSPDDKNWHIYDLGKKMYIVAYNFLNDTSYTTGGYKQKVGEKKLINKNTGKVLARKSVYEYVPMEIHGSHGVDKKYNAPTIVITTDMVDMSGMGGPMISLKRFRVETIDGKKYLINDDCGFAFYYDGDYLEYCEPDAYGYYQGFYAFNMTDSLVNITAIYDSYESY